MLLVGEYAHVSIPIGPGGVDRNTTERELGAMFWRAIRAAPRHESELRLAHLG